MYLKKKTKHIKKLSNGFDRNFHMPIKGIKALIFKINKLIAHKVFVEKIKHIERHKFTPLFQNLTET